VYGSGDRYDELGDEAYEVLVEPELADFVSHSFEVLCCSAPERSIRITQLRTPGSGGTTTTRSTSAGLTTGETLIVGECKFQQSPLGYDALSKLEGHVGELRWSPDSGRDRAERYALFSRSGFTQSVEEAADERDNLRLFTVDDVVDALTA